MEDELHDALMAFVHCREIKKELQQKHQPTSPEFETAYDQFKTKVPKSHDPEALFQEWEMAFNQAELMHHHQGG